MNVFGFVVEFVIVFDSSGFGKVGDGVFVGFVIGK